MFVWDVLKTKGYLVPKAMDSISMQPILGLKYEIARDLARKWSKMTFVDAVLEPRDSRQENEE